MIFLAGVALLGSGIYVSFGSVETIPGQPCDGPAAWAWTRTDVEPCRKDAIDQLVGGVMFAITGLGLLALVHHLWRAARRGDRLEPPIGPVAGTNPATVDSLRRARRAAALYTLGGFGALAAFVVSAVALDDRATSLAATATRTNGTVIDPALPWYRDLLGEAVGIEFIVSGDTLTATVHLNDSSPSYAIGQVVTVLYAEDDPSRATIAGEDNDAPGFVWPMIAALIGGAGLLLTGLVRVRRWARSRHITGRSAWSPRTVSLYVTGGRDVKWLMVSADDGQIAKLSGVHAREVQQLRWSVDGDEVDVWLAGTAATGMVVARAGGEIIGGAHGPRSDRRRRGWNAVVAEADEISGVPEPDGR